MCTLEDELDASIATAEFALAGLCDGLRAGRAAWPLRLQLRWNAHVGCKRPVPTRGCESPRHQLARSRPCLLARCSHESCSAMLVSCGLASASTSLDVALPRTRRAAPLWEGQGRGCHRRKWRRQGQDRLRVGAAGHFDRVAPGSECPPAQAPARHSLASQRSERSRSGHRSAHLDWAPPSPRPTSAFDCDDDARRSHAYHSTWPTADHRSRIVCVGTARWRLPSASSRWPRERSRGTMRRPGVTAAPVGGRRFS